MYFSDYQAGPNHEQLAEDVRERARDVGGEYLSFIHLGDRGLEILAYFLLHREHTPRGDRVVLMQGVGDQGRDVVVYSKQGKLIRIVQCKNYKDRFSAPSLRRELLKLALYSHLEPSILEDGPVSYELWCPGGLTTPAAKVLNSWPREWTPDSLAADAAEVIESYAKFDGLSWTTVGSQVVEEFARIVTPIRIEALLITQKVRQEPSIYERYFEGKIVMARADALEAFAQAQRRMIEEVPQAVTRALEAVGLRALTDADGKHLLERISAFPKERRHAHLTGYVMGLSHELVSKLDPKELDQFIRHSSGATMNMLNIVISACARIASETALLFQNQMRPRSGSLSLVFLRVLTLSMSARVTGMLMGTRKLSPHLEAFAGYDLRQRFVSSAAWTWDVCQQCLVRYAQGVEGSLEETRYRIAVNALGGAATPEIFQQDLLEALRQHITEIEKRYDEFMNLVPDQILIVTDTMSAFDNKALADRMIETMKTFERLRGLAAE